MNAARRKQIEQIKTKIEALAALRDEIAEMIQTVRDEEQDARDALPESLQDGDRGQKMQAAIDALDEAISEIEGIDPENSTSSLNTAAE